MQHPAFPRIALLLAALQQILAPWLVFPDGQFGGFTAAQSLPTPAQPAGYAFAIWGPIYLGCLVMAVHTARARGRVAELLVRLAWPCVALFLGSTLWLWCARHGPLWATVPVIWAMWGLAVLVMLRLARARFALPRLTKLAAGWPLALYAGWLSAAAFVNSATILPVYGTGTAGLGAAGLGVVMIAMAAMLAILVLRLARGALPYALAVGWALLGIIIANRPPQGEAAALWAAVLAVALLGGALLAMRRRRRPAYA